MAVRAALTAQYHHTSAESAKEHAVMRYEDHRAFKVLQGIHQHLLGQMWATPSVAMCSINKDMRYFESICTIAYRIDLSCSSQ
jgi:hypothetical protein